MSAENDAQREVLEKFLIMLPNELEWLEGEYYWTTYTIYMLESDIETLNEEIETIEESFAVAHAWLNYATNARKPLNFSQQTRWLSFDSGRVFFCFGSPSGF